MKTTEITRNAAPRPAPAGSFTVPVMILLLVTVAAAGGMLFFKLPDTGLLWSALQNSGHFVAFLFLSLIYIVIGCRLFPDRQLAVIVSSAVLLCAVGAAIELFQLTQHDRSTSVGDLLRNVAGIAAGVLVWCAFSDNSLWRRLTLFAAAIAIAVGVNITSISLLGYHLLKSDSPWLVNFDDRFVESHLAAVGGADIARLQRSDSEHSALQVRFGTEKYSGVRIINSGAPWQAAEQLLIEIYNLEQTQQKIHLRIHDVEHNNRYADRFNRVFQLSPGLNTLTIAGERY